MKWLNMWEDPHEICVHKTESSEDAHKMGKYIWPAPWCIVSANRDMFMTLLCHIKKYKHIILWCTLLMWLLGFGFMSLPKLIQIHESIWTDSDSWVCLNRFTAVNFLDQLFTDTEGIMNNKDWYKDVWIGMNRLTVPVILAGHLFQHLF